MSLKSDLTSWYNKMTGVAPTRQVNGRFKKITTQDIDQVEKQLGMVLPHTYREFLLNSNGEPPYFDTCDVSTEDDEDKILYSFTIRKFIALGPGGVGELIRNYLNFKTRLPERMLPIAFDKFRNLMCLELGTGKVFFWDMQSILEESRKNRERHSLYLVSPNFEKFNEKLYKQNKFL